MLVPKYLDRKDLYIGVGCAPNCIRCSNKNSSVCLDCLRDADVLINGTCKTKCPNQYYYFN